LNNPARKSGPINILIDRGVVNNDEDTQFRIADSAQTAFFEGDGECFAQIDGSSPLHFSDRFEKDGIVFTIPSANFFSFNNPFGACRNCEGFGRVLGIDADLVIADKSLSIFDGAIVPWRSEKMKRWWRQLIESASQFDFPIHRPYKDLEKVHQKLLWTGNKHFKGINQFFNYIESKSHKIQYRVMLSRYRGRTECPDCKGTRLRKDASYVKINDVSIIDLVLLPIDEVQKFFLMKSVCQIHKRMLRID